MSASLFTRLRFHLMVALCATAVAGSIGLVGCGGGGESSTGSSGADSAAVDDAREDADDSRAKAEAAGAKKYAKSDFEDAIQNYEKGEDADDPSRAKSYFRRARSLFDGATEAAEKSKADFDEYETLKAEFDKLKEKADEAGAAELVARAYEKAVESYDGAVREMDSGDAKKASREMKFARNDLEAVVDDIDRVKKQAERALEAKTLMAEVKKLAEEENSAEHALTDLDYARTLERKAEDFFEDKKFDMAMRSFEDARKNYTYAVDTARRARGTAELLADRAERSSTPVDDDSGTGTSDTEAISPPPPIDGDVARGGDGDGGSSDGGASDAGEIDYDVMRNIQKLFETTADYAKGFLTLGWENDGSVFQKDCTVLYGTLDKDVYFVGDTNTGFKEYVFGGNTRGSLLINARFKDTVRIRFDVAFQLWGAEANRWFEMMFMSDPAGQNYHALQIGNRGIMSVTYRDGHPVAGESSRIKAQRADVNRWLQRRDSRVFDVIMRPKDDGDSYSITVEFGGEKIIERTVKSTTEGFVGFKWLEGKFFVKSIDVKGTLDTEWAKAAIKKKTGGAGGEDDGDDDLDF